MFSRILANCSYPRVFENSKNVFKRRNSLKYYCTEGKSKMDQESVTQTAWEPLADPSKYRGVIPLKKLEISYTTSSAPGGQNVNKSSTRAEVRFRVDECDWIASPTRENFFDVHKNRINKDGYFIMRSERTRSQSSNLVDCLEKLRSSIRDCEKQASKQAALQPSEKDLELMRNRQESAAKRRIEEKRYASAKNRERKLDDLV